MCQCSGSLLLQHLIYLHKKQDNGRKRASKREGRQSDRQPWVWIWLKTHSSCAGEGTLKRLSPDILLLRCCCMCCENKLLSYSLIMFVQSQGIVPKARQNATQPVNRLWDFFHEKKKHLSRKFKNLQITLKINPTNKAEKKLRLLFNNIC